MSRFFPSRGIGIDRGKTEARQIPDIARMPVQAWPQCEEKHVGHASEAACRDMVLIRIRFVREPSRIKIKSLSDSELRLESPFPRRE